MVILPTLCSTQSQAAEFCTFCKRSIKNLGRPYRSELQLSGLEVIEA